MNETQSAVAEQEPDSFLAEGLAQTSGVDTSGYHTQPKADDNSTEKIETQDRGTDEPAAKETTDSVESDKASATTPTAEPVKGKARAPNRIAELLAQVKELKTKNEEYEKAKAAPQTPTTATQATAPQAQQTPTMIPKPEYTAEVLKGILKKKQFELDDHIVNADLPKIRETREFMENVQEKLAEANNWEQRNKQAVDQYNHAMTHYRNEVLKQWPDMGKENSPIRQEHAKVYARFQELQKNPALLEHELASIASIRLRAAGMAALEETNKQLQQKLATYEKKSQPLKQEEAPAAATGRDTDDPDADLLRGIRQMLPRKR